jgi:large subunit ribosomal protein L25
LEIFDLKVNKREATGKGPAREFRRQGIVPAVLYGPKMETVLLAVSGYELENIYKQSESEHVLLNLVIENGGTQKKTAMIKEIQTTPVADEFLHVDFYEISLDEEIVVKIPVEATGKSVGIERGGFLQLVRHQLEVSCLPTNIPATIQIDITELDIGDSIHVEDIDPGDKVKLLFDNNFTVVTVVAPAAEEEEVLEEEELEEGEAVEGEAAEEKEAAPEEPADK